MTSFRDKLKEIRHEERSERIPLTDEELGLNDGSELFLKARDDLARFIEHLMRDFTSETPSFHVNHGFFEGKYSIALSCDELCKDHRGEVDKCFSRLNFLLDPKAADDRFEITGKLTVLNKDLPKASLRGNITDPDDNQKMREFAEAETLRFAREYYALRNPAASREEPAPTH